MKRKTINLQPWLDYFGMLKTFEGHGYLEILVDKHEAFVTQPAIHAMTEGNDPQKQLGSILTNTVMRIRAYAAWKSRTDMTYTKKPFALHVVKDTEPYDMIYTILISYRRRFWSPWRQEEYIEIIPYIK